MANRHIRLPRANRALFIKAGYAWMLQRRCYPLVVSAEADVPLFPVALIAEVGGTLKRAEICTAKVAWNGHLFETTGLKCHAYADGSVSS